LYLKSIREETYLSLPSDSAEGEVDSMIDIQVRTHTQKVRGVIVTGHGGGSAGSDILCAAVSAVAETALAGMLYYDSEGIDWEMREGFISIQMRESADERLDAVLTTLIIGLRQIAKEHPERIRLHLEQDSGIPDET
jgi:hypothetical protein